MKTKRLFSTLALGSLLAMGALVGVKFANGFAEAKADGPETRTVYCKMTYGWWKINEQSQPAAIGVHYWGGESAGTAWPGIRMTAVATDVDVWKYDVPVDITGIMFVRVSGSGDIADWGAKTADLTLQDGKNLYTITSETEVWGDPGVTGEWSAYVEPEPVDPEYHLVGTFNEWTASNDNLLTVDPEDDNHYTIDDVILEKDDELKVHDTAKDIWYTNGTESANVVVGEDGTYDVDFYVVADNNIHIVLTKEVVEPVYTIVNRDNAPVTFVLDEEEKPEGVLHQYSAEVQYAKRGGKLQFFKDGVEITEKIGVDYTGKEPTPGNNIYGNVTDGFRLYHTSNYTGMTKIYLKTYEDGGISLWGEGYGENNFYTGIKTSSTTTGYYFVRDEEYVANETYIEQYKTSKAVAIDALGGTDWLTSNTLDCGGLSEDANIEAGEENNAKAAFQKSAWTVYNDCTEVVYLKVKRSDLSLWLYVGGKTHAYTVTVGGNQLELDNYNSETHEYYTTFGAVAGQTVTAMTKDGGEQTYTFKQIGNNNIDAENKIIVSGNQTIYFDTDTNELFISGLEFGGYHIIKNAGTVEAKFIQMTHGDEWEGFDQYYSAALDFALNDTISFVNTTAADALPEVFDITKINEGGLGDKFAVAEGKIKCIEACQTAVYMKLKYGLDEVYFGDVPEYLQNAIDFANEFVADITTACGADEETRAAAVKAAWDLKATAYAALSEEAQNALKEGKSSSVLEIRLFGEKYEAIYLKRGTKYALSNFMEWSFEASNYMNEATFDNTIILVITIAAAASLCGLALFLAIKKRKHQ